MTEKPKHTPGPWKESDFCYGVIVSDSKLGTDSSEIVVEAYGGNMVCDCVSSENIKLIAAAPEMYALIERVVKSFEDTDSSWANFVEHMIYFCLDAQKLIEKIREE